MIEGDAVVREVFLAAPRRSVFAMLTQPEELVRWIGIAAQLDPRPGGLFRFEIVPGQYCEGRYLEVEPESRLVFTWGWTNPAMGLPPGSSRVEISLADVQGGTLLRLVHRPLTGDQRLLHDDGWRQFLDRLSALAAGLPSPSYPAGRPRDRLHELKGGMS